MGTGFEAGGGKGGKAPLIVATYEVSPNTNIRTIHRLMVYCTGI